MAPTFNRSEIFQLSDATVFIEQLDALSNPDRYADFFSSDPFYPDRDDQIGETVHRIVRDPGVSVSEKAEVILTSFRPVARFMFNNLQQPPTDFYEQTTTHFQKSFNGKYLSEYLSDWRGNPVELDVVTILPGKRVIKEMIGQVDRMDHLRIIRNPQLERLIIERYIPDLLFPRFVDREPSNN